MTALVWYRDDLRVSDHSALHAAANSHASVALVYVLDDRAPGVRPLGGAARWWLAQSLRALQASLRQRGASLVLRKGSASAVIVALAREAGAEAVYWNEIAQAPHRAVEDQVATALSESGIATHRFPGDLLGSPNQIRNKENRGLRVFTPFWRRVQALGDPPKPLPAPKTLKGVTDLASDRLEDWTLEPTRPDWAGGLRDNWQPGEAAAQAALKAFLGGGIAGYSGDRDRPDTHLDPVVARALPGDRRRTRHRMRGVGVAVRVAPRPELPGHGQLALHALERLLEALADIQAEPARASYWSPPLRFATIVPFTRTTVPSSPASTL